MSVFHIITPSSLRPRPTTSEYLVAEIIAEFFTSDVRFVEPSTIHAPDLYVVRTRKTWEVKNIKGNSKRTIANNLRKAKYQSKNIIISLFDTKMTPNQATSRILEYLNSGPSGIDKILVITKTKKVIAIL